MDKDLINEIRSKNDIVEVISSYLPLSKKGRNYFGVCPFHDDNNPSMSVSPERQIYKCFSCGATGNVFTFVMDYEKLSFVDAVRILGDKVGIKTGNFKNKNMYNANQKYYELYDYATSFYQNNLASSQGKKALDYLRKRKIDDDAIKHFKIGLSLASENLTKILKAKNYNEIELEKYGISNGNYDKYQDRIMFPLSDSLGRITGFSGRVYNNFSEAKYINTMETDIFKKGETLYNYQAAKNEARTKGFVIVVEGFMDVIRLYVNGYKNVLALMGTAMTKEQALLIKKVSNEIYFCLDGDNAGRKATIKNVDEYFKNDNVKVIVMPNDIDPDEYIIKNGKLEFDKRYQNAMAYYDFKLAYYKTKTDFTNDVELLSYINFMLKDIALIKDDIRREIALKKLAKETNIEYNTLEKRLGASKGEIDNKKQLVNKTEDKINLKYEKAEVYFVKLMMNYSEVIDIFRNEKIRFTDDKLNKFAYIIDDFYNKNAFINEADFYTSILDDKDYLDIYKKISVNEMLDYSKEFAFDLVKTIRENFRILAMKDISRKIKEEIDPLNKAKLADELRKLKIGDINDKRS